ncbi:T6SS immunity protein Tli4 family protein [Telluria beijingensis]|uniref:T6SS immunity protein Tli4 family protein n=1 Tax=Telluria beijingensis TaxID=3068633 RepID=UPI0027954F5A|nr:T6SS immunity protein Tli4 family protein [Massilia sp. REN29]
MKRVRGRRVRWVCGLTAVVLALTSFLANSVQTVHDKQKVAKMTEKMRTVCLGRFLIDLPADAPVKVKYGSVGGLDIETISAESDEEFAERLRQAELDMAEATNREGRPSLESSKEIAVDTGQGKIFIYNRRRTKVLEDHEFVFSENVALLSMLRFPDLSVTGEIEWVAPRNLPRVSSILNFIRPLNEGEIPRESGFCLGHAIVLDPYDHDNRESAVMFAGLPGHPDVNIVLSSMAGASPAPGLLERNAKAEAREPIYMRLAFSNLREHKRVINGLEGEELVLRIREPSFTTGYSFQWEMAGKQDDVHTPTLKLELESGVNPVAGGKPVQSTLTEEAMFELWESIVSSIRLRPYQEAKTAVSEEPHIALGASVLAGEVCPQTGWWQCADGGGDVSVLGGQRQFIKQGQTMPQALLLPQQTMWQRLRGVQPSYESRNSTLWALVDKRSSSRITHQSGLEQAVATQDFLNFPAGTGPAGSFQAPIGSIARTGAACPASGWWRCEDSHALDGTRWFAAGSLLPAATFRAHLARRSGGHPELIHRRSAWQLVRVDADPLPGVVADPATSQDFDDTSRA